jgi:hypothetical protein
LSSSYEQFVGKYGLIELLSMSTSALREMFQIVTNKGCSRVFSGSNNVEHLYMQYDMKCTMCTDSVFVWSSLLLSPLISVTGIAAHCYLYSQQKKITDRKNFVKSTATIFVKKSQIKFSHFHLSLGVMVTKTASSLVTLCSLLF